MAKSMLLISRQAPWSGPGAREALDIALAGGVSLRFPQEAGYLHQRDGILSQDGHCRPFDADASGTIFGDTPVTSVIVSAR